MNLTELNINVVWPPKGLTKVPDKVYTHTAIISKDFTDAEDAWGFVDDIKAIPTILEAKGDFKNFEVVCRVIVDITKKDTNKEASQTPFNAALLSVLEDYENTGYLADFNYIIEE